LAPIKKKTFASFVQLEMTEYAAQVLEDFLLGHDTVN
jgi:hypothetical protein